MEFCLQPLGFMKILQKNNHQVVNKKKEKKMPDNCWFVKTGVADKIPWH